MNQVILSAKMVTNFGGNHKNSKLAMAIVSKTEQRDIGDIYFHLIHYHFHS